MGQCPAPLHYAPPGSGRMNVVCYNTTAHSAVDSLSHVGDETKTSANKTTRLQDLSHSSSWYIVWNSSRQGLCQTRIAAHVRAFTPKHFPTIFILTMCAVTYVSITITLERLHIKSGCFVYDDWRVLAWHRAPHLLINHQLFERPRAWYTIMLLIIYGFYT